MVLYFQKQNQQGIIVRRKKAHIFWQPIAAKKRKLRNRLKNAGCFSRMDEKAIDGKDDLNSCSNKASIRSVLIPENTTSKLDSEITCTDAYPIPYDEYLLERARTQWQFGDWENLVKMNVETIQHHPDRAKLALLAAAGHLQTSDNNAAMQYIQLAQGWGCSKKQVIQILVSGVHNSLGRAAAIGNQPQRALHHFVSAITFGTPGSAINLIANAREHHELGTLGLIPGGQGRLQQYKALSDISKPSDKPTSPAVPKLCQTSEAHAFYINLGHTEEHDPIPYLLIDSKSLPRSGLHYLKNALIKVFGEHFSFCEWYQEPGCCKKMPCALTGFATHAAETRNLRIRLTKSHDFELRDPVFETTPYLRRLVLVRDPLFILTSWFALEQLNSYKDMLAKNGININKIWLAHEKEVLKPAYSLLDDHFIPPPLSQLTDWLIKKSEYIDGFIDKWVKPGLDHPETHIQVVRYDEVNYYIDRLVNEYRPFLSEIAAQSIDKAAIQSRQQFNKREDPFYVPSESVSNYIRSNSMLFVEAARKLDIF